MARYNTNRKIIRKVKKVKWAVFHDSYIQSSGRNQSTYPVETNTYCGYARIIYNSNQASDPTPTVIKVGNPKMTCDASVVADANVLCNVAFMISFVPEGYLEGFTGSQEAAKLATIPAQHPEWILTYGSLGSNTSGGTATLLQYDPRTFSSRMKRNLQSGDSLYIICIANADRVESGSSQISRLDWTADILCYLCKN